MLWHNSLCSVEACERDSTSAHRVTRVQQKDPKNAEAPDLSQDGPPSASRKSRRNCQQALREHHTTGEDGWQNTGESKQAFTTLRLQPKGCPANTQSFSVHQSILRMEGTSRHWQPWASDTHQTEPRLQPDVLNKAIGNEIKEESSKVTPCSFSPSPCLTTSCDPPQSWECNLIYTQTAPQRENISIPW